MTTKEMEDKMEELDNKIDDLLLPALQSGIKQGKLKPGIYDADKEMQIYLAGKIDTRINEMHDEIHNLNLQWNIAKGLY